jgi:hypothetical protein
LLKNDRTIRQARVRVEAAEVGQAPEVRSGVDP